MWLSALWLNGHTCNHLTSLVVPRISVAEFKKDKTRESGQAKTSTYCYRHFRMEKSGDPGLPFPAWYPSRRIWKKKTPLRWIEKKNDHIRKNLTKNGEPLYSWECRRRRRKKKKNNSLALKSPLRLTSYRIVFVTIYVSDKFITLEVIKFPFSLLFLNQLFLAQTISSSPPPKHIVRLYYECD